MENDVCGHSYITAVCNQGGTRGRAGGNVTASVSRHYHRGMDSIL